MENPCKIIMFGDSIAKGCAEIFREAIAREYRDVELTVINAGIDGETSTEGVSRLQNILSQNPNVVVIGFGMNDWRKGVDKETFGKNLRTMIDTLENNGVRVVLMTIIPDYQGFRKGMSPEINEYNCVIYNVAEERRIRIADVNALWKREIKPIWRGLADQIHPNSKGYQLICKALMRVVPRRNTTVLWGYDGAAAPCNYRCPYCIDESLGQRRHHVLGTMDHWHDAFKKAFGNQHIVFYISYGEPMVGKKFYEMMEMLATEPNWEMMMTTNLSQPLDRLVKTRLAREGRLNINVSFHPTETTIEEFLNKLLFLREHGIECPVVYVLYPPLMKDFESHSHIFNKHNFLVHVRRFSGKYNGKIYPRDYTEQERRFVAKYADDTTIKYMLNEPNLWGKLSYHGMYYIFVTSEGDVGTEYFYGSNGRRLGNILKGTMKLDIEPQPLLQFGEGSVSGVASILETGYHELQRNFVLSFAKQGGVYHTDNGVHYPHLQTDFGNRKIRTAYNFPTKIDKLKINVLFNPHFLRQYGMQILRSKIHRFLYILYLVGRLIMPFGYIPHKTPWKNAISKILGNPNMMRRIQAPVIMKMVKPQKDDVVLDTGCGGGFFTYEIAKICRCIGIDWNISDNLSYAMHKSSSVAYMKADVQEMPFKDGTFDKILLSSLLQMVEDDEMLLEECHRVLKEDGILVLSVPVEYIYIKKLNELKGELTDKFGSRGKGFYEYDEVIKLLQEEKFEIIETEYSPKRWGSFIYVTWLYFCYRVGLPLFHLFYFPFLYPIAYFDRFGNKKQRGNEVIIKTRKK